MRITNMEDLQKAFASCQTSVETMMQEARQQKNREAMQLLTQIWLRLRQGPVRTLVLGVSSAGKSTLINAVSGTIVVPEGKHATSPIPVWVYSRNPDITPEIQLLGYAENEIKATSCGLYPYLTEYCYTSEQAGAGTGQEKYQDLVAATVDVNAPALKAPGITLVDTPGIGVSGGDNDRVREVLSSGCEALIIMFKTLQEEDTQAYFRDLLIEEDAPLRDLIEQGRVFLVLNIRKEYSCDNAKLDTRQHVKKTFDGWDCGERLYAMNAQDARICSCGIYQHVSHLPKGISSEVLTYAKKSLAKEVQRAQSAKPQEELDRLCTDLGEMVAEICEDPDSLEQILSPIEEKMHQAITLLKKPYEEKRSQIENAEYPAPPELEEQKKALSRQYDALIALHTWLHDTKGTLLDYPSVKWPDKKYPREILLHSEYLLTDEKKQTESFLQEEIAKNNGPGSIALLVEQRMDNRVKMLCDQLEDPKQNPESRYWDKFFSGLSDKLKEISDSGSMETLQEQELAACTSLLSEIPNKAKAAGRGELEGASCCRITADENRLMVEYLLKKQKTILNGGIRSQFERFMIWINFSVDMLDRILRRIIGDAVKCYRQAYRQCIKQEYEALFQKLHKVLFAACVSAGKRRNEIEDEIQRYKENAKNSRLAEVDAQLQQLDALVIFEKG